MYWVVSLQNSVVFHKLPKEKKFRKTLAALVHLLTYLDRLTWITQRLIITRLTEYSQRKIASVDQQFSPQAPIINRNLYGYHQLMKLQWKPCCCLHCSVEWYFFLGMNYSDIWTGSLYLSKQSADLIPTSTNQNRCLFIWSVSKNFWFCSSQNTSYWI